MTREVQRFGAAGRRHEAAQARREELLQRLRTFGIEVEGYELPVISLAQQQEILRACDAEWSRQAEGRASDEHAFVGAETEYHQDSVDAHDESGARSQGGDGGQPVSGQDTRDLSGSTGRVVDTADEMVDAAEHAPAQAVVSGAVETAQRQGMSEETSVSLPGDGDIMTLLEAALTTRS